MEGEFIAQKVSTQPSWVATDEGRIIYAEDADKFYIGDNSSWTELGREGNITTVNTSTYDLLITDYILSVTYTATGPVTSLTLPTAQCIERRIIHIKDSGGLAGTNNITIDTQGAETIDGNATKTMNTNYEAISIYSDGTNWYIY